MQQKPQYTTSLVEQSDKDSLDAVRYTHLFTTGICTKFIEQRFCQKTVFRRGLVYNSDLCTGQKIN